MEASIWEQLSNALERLTWKRWEKLTAIYLLNCLLLVGSVLPSWSS
jgi:hypothetical protein